MALTSAVVRDHWLYNGDMHVDVGNLTRHKRATVAEICELLRPDLKKAKTGSPTKDQVGHWYEAQLIHYGLPRSKDKATAKMRLLDSLNKSSLKVPQHILKLEGELRKEFNSNERKAKMQHRAQMAASSAKMAPPLKSRKRKNPDQHDSPPRFNINVNINASGLGGLASDSGDPFIARPVQQATTKILACTPKSSRQAKRAGSRAYPNPDVAILRAGQVPVVHAARSRRSKSVRTAKTRKGELAAASHLSVSRARKGSTKARKEADHQFPASKARANLAKPRLPKSRVQRRTGGKDGKPEVKTAADFLSNPAIGQKMELECLESYLKVGQKQATPRRQLFSVPSSEDSEGPCGARLGLINGVYDIFSDELIDPHDDHQIRLVLILDSPCVWGFYSFGSCNGILRLGQRPWRVGDTRLFYFRGTEDGFSDVNAGPESQGEITFAGNGHVHGRIHLRSTTCHFDGLRRPEGGKTLATITSMREHWDRMGAQAGCSSDPSLMKKEKHTGGFVKGTVHDPYTLNDEEQDEGKFDDEEWDDESCDEDETSEEDEVSEDEVSEENGLSDEDASSEEDALNGYDYWY